MAKSIDSIVAKQIDNLSRAGEAMKAGALALTEAPGKLAAANEERYLAGITKNVKKWKANVASVSLPSWQDSYINKGVPRVPEGIRQAEPKIREFHTQLQAFQASYLPKLNSKPVLSLSDAIAKAGENITNMSKFSFKRK